MCPRLPGPYHKAVSRAVLKVDYSFYLFTFKFIKMRGTRDEVGAVQNFSV